MSTILKSTPKRIAIVGSGVTGMAAAWDLARDGHAVDIYEAGSEVGGLAAGFSDESWDWSLEKFYHHWFQSDKDILRLIKEIGAEEQIIFKHPQTSYWIRGKIYRSEMNHSVFRLPISWYSLIRLGVVGIYLKFITRNWRRLEQITAHDWMAKWLGEEAYDSLWKPLLIGKFSSRFTEVNMAWLWARIYTRSLNLGTFEGGFQSFLNRLANSIVERGGHIHLRTPVERIERNEEGLALRLEKTSLVYDRVISTTSPQQLLKLSQDIRETPYGQQVAELESIGGICVVFALKESLLTDGTYWLNLPADSVDKKANPFPFLALVEHTNFVDKSHYGGDVIVYCGDYVPADHEYFHLSDEALVDRFVHALARVNPNFHPGWIRKTWAWRAPYAQPVPRINHSIRIPPLQTPVPGLYWASMSQVYPWDRGTNYAVEVGRRVAALVQNDL